MLESLWIWPDRPVLSLFVVWALSQLLLFAARTPVHRALGALGQGLAGGLRLVAHWCRRTAQELQTRNREVLLESGRVELEKKIDREFTRIHDGFTQELKQYPELHQRLTTLTARMESDFQESVNAPPEVPGWPEAMRGLGAVSELGERSGKRVLEEIRKGAVAAEKRALKEYRDGSAKRHKLLAAIAPVWKEVRNLSGRTLKVVSAALDNASRIDGHMEQYEKIRRGDDASERLLATSAWTLFAVSSLAMLIAAGGAFVNFQLIALPMSELVPGGSRLFGVSVSTVAALVLVLMEASAGLFLMEALGITELFPQVGRLSPGRKRIIFGVAFVGLFLLAAIESSLAVLREQIVAADILLKQSLSGTGDLDQAVAEPAMSSVPVIGQAVLGFILPWLLAMVAIPLEMLVHSSRHVGGWLLVAGLGFSASALRAIGHLWRSAMRALGALFDVYVALPVWVERLGRGLRDPAASEPRRKKARPEPTPAPRHSESY